MTQRTTISTPNLGRAAWGALLVLLALALASAAQGQVTRTFVSVTGSDLNNCSNIATPCRTFSGALTVVDSGGEIIVLDTGSYGGTTITKSVTLSVPSGVVAFAAQPFIVDVGSGSVTFRGLTLRALTASTGTAILFQSGAALTVDSCVVSEWEYGVDVAYPGRVTIRDSFFRDCYRGVMLRPNGGPSTAVVEHCRFERNGGSVIGAAFSKCVVRDSVFTFDGFSMACTPRGNPATLDIENCLVMGAFGSIDADGDPGVGIATATVTVSNTTVLKCTSGLRNLQNATLRTFGTNQVTGNTNNIVGTITPIAPK